MKKQKKRLKEKEWKKERNKTSSYAQNKSFAGSSLLAKTEAWMGGQMDQQKDGPTDRHTPLESCGSRLKKDGEK